MLRRLLLPVALLLVALCAGMWLGGHPSSLPGGLRKVFVDHDNAVVGEALGLLKHRYYRPVNGEDLDNAALRAAVNSLGDQYSAYLSKSDYKTFNQVQDARFDGIGVGVSPVPKGLKISRVYDASPAKTAGLKMNDIITKAAGKSLAGMTATAASNLIRGRDGTSVALEVLRGDKTLPFTVKRASVQVPVVETTYNAAAKVGVVRLGSFSTGAHGEVELGIKAMQKKGATAIVLDLRNNPGGLVNEAQLLAGLFLKGGTVVTTRGRDIPTNTLKAGDHPEFPTLPLDVLVDRNSASAAEIVTGALQDRKRAKVVGTRTYGKGVFQEVIPLEVAGGALDITVGQYYTPNGHNLGGAGVTAGKDVARGAGIKPDIPAVDDPKTKVDEAQQAAINAVKQ